jgi:hypothetical protein
MSIDRRSLPSPVAPAGGTGLRELDHRLAVSGDAILVEGRLREPPLPPPEVPVAREQPGPEDPLEILREAVLLELLVLSDADGLDDLGVVDHHRLHAHELDEHEPPPLRRALEEAEGVAGVREDVPEDR